MVDVQCSNATVRIEALAPDLFRVRMTKDATFAPPFSYAVDRYEWPAPEVRVEESDQALDIHTSAVTCRVQKRPCRLTFLDMEGHVISADAEGMGWQGERVICRKTLAPDEHFYGLGEKAFQLERCGRMYEMWNTDPATYAPGDDPIYQSVPFLLGLRAGLGYGIFFDNSFRSCFDLGATEPDVYSFSADGGEMRYYFFFGPSLLAVLERYTELTGRMSLPPRWALGYHQSRWSYYPESRVRALSKEFRRRRIPCDVIYLDIHYMDGYRCFTWDRNRFPDPWQLLADLRQAGFKTVTIIDPGIKVDPGYWVHDEGLSEGMFCMYPDGRLFHGPVWPGDCYFPDFTNPRVRTWWGRLYESLLDDGVVGFWNDMNEPSVFGGGTMPDAVVHEFEGRRGTHREAHNVYGLLMARACYEGLRTLQPDSRPFVITRAAFAGVQRYALVWTGDNESTWEHLRLTTSMCISLGLSGVPFVGADVGGFAGAPDAELFTRWVQLGAFTPFFRTHTAAGTPPQEPWSYGEPYESISRRFIELRYQLLPYFYTAFHQATARGIPIMRPLVLAYQNDPRTHELDDEFLLGDALLIAPVMQPGATGRAVYLPAGKWYDFWTGEVVSGEQELWVDAPLETMPIFVRAGSVIPMQPVMQYVDERPLEALALHVYPGNGRNELYEDDGQTLAYRRDVYRLTTFRCYRQSNGMEMVRESRGAFRPPYRRFDIHIHGLPEAPKVVIVDGQPQETWQFDPASGTLRFETGIALRIAVRW